ncbi:MAG: NAD(P)H-hydrate dehydratase [Planctomycetota bacterium]|nr:NAD(P)H-hydrate dehydratase [Planctomycetota bacterium]
MSSKTQQIQSIPTIPDRKGDAHKGDFGRMLVVGGARGMIGAPALAANAALRGGAGLVTVAVPETVQLAVASLCPCATSIRLKCSRSGDLAPQAVAQMLTAADASDVLAVGPGMGVSGGAGNIVRAAIEQDKPVVLDADGLNNLARIDGWAGLRRCPLVLTPHPGEMARLTDKSVEQIQSDREGSAVAAAEQWSVSSEDASEGGTGCLQPVLLRKQKEHGLQASRATLQLENNRALAVVLKGAGTVVTDGLRVFINKTGNPGMATGGTGDVLTGLIAALIGQGMDILEASCLGVHVHGLAGDLAAEKLGQTSLIASDLPDFLPEAIQKTALT